MMEFGNLAELAHHLMAKTVGELEETQKGVEAAANLLQREIKAEFGEYQVGAGPFAAWPELADATKADRVTRGFTENDPLLRSGELRDSIEKEVGHWEATIGSTDPVMLWQEMGTARMPPRPALGIALYRNLDNVRALVAEAAFSGLMGTAPIDPAKGYNIP